MGLNSQTTYKIFVATRTKEQHEKIMKKMSEDFHSVSTGMFTIAMCYANAEFFRNLLYLEELKKDNSILAIRSEEIHKIEKNNKLLTRRCKELEKENKLLKKDLREIKHILLELKDAKTN